MSGESGQEGPPQEKTGETTQATPDVPRPRTAADIIAEADERQKNPPTTPPKTIPQFKTFSMDPLSAITTAGEEGAKDKKTALEVLQEMKGNGDKSKENTEPTAGEPTPKINPEFPETQE